ncbi:hypothetical protein [Zhongshania sp.]|uniref:hypothetical protein n=1 Tax=Zhongshania sp. TaxID=1971902 RepID=UPI003565E2C3
MRDEAKTPSAADQFASSEAAKENTGADGDNLAQLIAACGEYLDSSLVLAQLHGQRCLLSLFKMLLLWIATLVLLIATWLSVLLAVFEFAAQMGAPPALIMLLFALSNLVLAWWCWRSLCSRLQGVFGRPQNNALAGGGSEVDYER